MVKNEKQPIEEIRAKQGCPADSPEPYKIAASTPFDFGAKNLTPYGGLFPVGTMLEKLGFKKLVEESLTIHRIPRVMTIYQFLLGMVLAIYLGFSRLNHLRFLAQDPMLTGVLQVRELPPQCTFWRFLTALPMTVAQQLLKLQRLLRERDEQKRVISHASPTRPTSRLLPTLSYRCSLASAFMLCQRFVRTTPGHTALTRMGANSTAKARVKASIVPQTLAATVHPLCGRRPATPVVSTIEPSLRISGLAYLTAARAAQ